MSSSSQWSEGTNEEDSADILIGLVLIFHSLGKLICMMRHWGRGLCVASISVNVKVFLTLKTPNITCHKDLYQSFFNAMDTFFCSP